jgi:hypothetical protein
MGRKRFGLLLPAVTLVAMVFNLVACTVEDTGNTPETVPVSMNDKADIDDCDEEAALQDGRGGELEPARFTTGEYAGQYNPADIRGSHTMDDISRYFEIPLPVLSEAFDMPEEEAGSIQNKYYKYIFEGLLGSGKNIGNGSMVAFVSMYKGLPFELHEPEYLLEPAADILKSLGTLSAGELDYLSRYVVSLEEAGAVPLTEFIPPEDGFDDDFQIYGRTTFEDLLGMGMSREQISEIIGARIPDTNTSVKDYCVENGLSFSDDVKLQIFEILYNL